eukprot:354625-Chlamydomonas_euryale.AAC.10
MGELEGRRIAHSSGQTQGVGFAPMRESPATARKQCKKTEGSGACPSPGGLHPVGDTSRQWPRSLRNPQPAPICMPYTTPVRRPP